MKYLKYFLISLVLLTLLSFNSFGQEFNKTKGASDYHATITFKDVVAWDQANPAPGPKMKTPNKEVFKYPEFPLDGKNILYKDKVRMFDQKPIQTTFKEQSPIPTKDFLALEDNNNSIPPDVNGAAGPNHLMVTLNTEIRISDRDGNPISTVGTGSFWHPMPGSGGVFDPKVIFDPYDQRWILLMPSSSDPASSRLMVAVSENEDPTGTWFMYAFDTDPTNQTWFDYPNFGFNKNWIVVTGNMFGNGFYSTVFVLDKADLYSNSPVADYSRFEVYDGFTLVPAKTYDTEEEDIYMVNNAGGNVNGKGYLNLWRVSGGYGNEQVEDLGVIEIADPWGNGSYANGGNFAPQLGTDQKINTVDARMENMVYRNGKLWTVHHVYLPANNPNRCSVQWFELGLDGTILQRGRVDDEDGNHCYAFTSIAVNSKEDVMIGYGSFSPEQYASCSYSFRYADDPPNTLRDSYQYKDGLASYWKTFGGDRNRWGDYTGTVVDPVDDLDFWTLQEYADLPGSQDQWSTWWANINLDAVPKAEFTANITSVPTGSGISFTDFTKYEPTEWLWIFEGGTPTTSIDQNPPNIIYSNSGMYTVTLIATNYLGSDTLIMEDYINSNTTILPEVAFAISDSVPCSGSNVLLEDMSIYNANGWLWEFYPNHVTFENGTNENSQNPEISFNLSMPYTITLTAQNLNGSKSITKTAFVKSGGKYLPFIEDFENLDPVGKGWMIQNPDGDKTWEVVNVGGTVPGEYSACVKMRSYNGNGERDQLITPLINFTDYNAATLEFQYAYAQRFPQYTDSLIVYLSSNCGDEMIRLLALGEDSLNNFATVPPVTLNFIPESAEDWCGNGINPNCISIDLTPWIGTPNLNIIFETYNGFGNNIYVDNISIEGTLSAIEETEILKNRIHVFPNPSHGELKLVLNGFDEVLPLTILNMKGDVVFIDNIDCSSSLTSRNYDFEFLSKGLYLVSVRSKDGIFTRKFILE